MKDHVRDMLCGLLDALYIWTQTGAEGELARRMHVEMERLVAFLRDEKIDLATHCRFYHE